MKKRAHFCFLCLLLVLTTGCSNVDNVNDNKLSKVIYDCDPYFFNDDSMTMTLLVEADNQKLIDLLGITITNAT